MCNFWTDCPEINLLHESHETHFLKILSSKNYAAEECTKIGADLAIVNSNAERIALWNLISK
jgi:hypothetical protein